MTIQKFLILAGGWFLVVAGILISPIPIPVPFPVGAMVPRHRNNWLSRAL